ncbi:DUF742 domain-containing protein [Streptomyces caniscabiei]|uniref:DUF742 domain-containing protein n=1 Tax=Streptomyces caniscabiei TaxID=2746961 RepID=A0A927LAK4_9ACTN|nr:DUF742 domain-containing protein [Streptomyces caniscabiei]MBD9728417.1 DUF742 domain-containing protein [Streptomyces caniscabiei]MDX3509717.1 DUF742 domain-containing protein [Streptomyces caniscabiei]MDX3723443.1 DUF742 domain-containing protein [Streptomyces caniscabiei]MDX3730063.1 DUF742 domain-containing protein [Streptomyces caniscabiei]WEO28198.1 DUF742 domain-containing protein [Streptomyces caniscabiei]
MTPPQRRRRQPKHEPSPPPPLPSSPPSPSSPSGGEDATGGSGGRPPERLYILTGADGERAPIDLVTLIVARADPPPSAAPEQSALLRICQAPLSVAEISAYLNLPISVVTVLLTELLTAELVQARAPVVKQARADRSLLEAVMHGLQKL